MQKKLSYFSNPYLKKHGYTNIRIKKNWTKCKGYVEDIIESIKLVKWNATFGGLNNIFNIQNEYYS